MGVAASVRGQGRHPDGKSPLPQAAYEDGSRFQVPVAVTPNAILFLQTIARFQRVMLKIWKAAALRAAFCRIFAMFSLRGWTIPHYNAATASPIRPDVDRVADMALRAYRHNNGNPNEVGAPLAVNRGSPNDVGAPLAVNSGSPNDVGAPLAVTAGSPKTDEVGLPSAVMTGKSNRRDRGAGPWVTGLSRPSERTDGKPVTAPNGAGWEDRTGNRNADDNGAASS